MLESLSVSAMLAAAGEFDQGGVFYVIIPIVAGFFTVLQAQAFDQQLPEFPVFEIAIPIRVQARHFEFFAQQVIFFEPGPQHGKVVQDIQPGQMIALAQLAFGQLC